MDIQEKLSCIADSVELDSSEISPDTVLSDLENWDSVAVLSVIAFINEKFNKFPSAEDIIGCKTVQDLMDLMQ